MRDLKPCENNKLTLNDPMGGEPVELFYRQPTTKERIAYQNAQVERKGGKVEVKTPLVRFDYGMEILTGIGDKSFCFGGQPISSKPDNPNYRADWKALVGEIGGDLIQALSVVIFEGVTLAPVESNGGKDKEEDPGPLSMSGAA